ncbi:hypothetical protein VP01_3283g1 [Puccinia sorghi]|uniref:Uncharacterized protein n=1 Tax=Puccinia sorghi TaxID=27349 RepID=A0A0L6UXP4_9BASI|nr:hypothetical protein VP01_3283g1 [Puccinia sorghi]
MCPPNFSEEAKQYQLAHYAELLSLSLKKIFIFFPSLTVLILLLNSHSHRNKKIRLLVFSNSFIFCNANLPLGSITDRWFTWARILRKNGLKSILLLNLLAQLQDPLASHPCQPLPSGCPVIHSNDNQTSKYPNSMDIEAINLAFPFCQVIIDRKTFSINLINQNQHKLPPYLWMFLLCPPNYIFSLLALPPMIFHPTDCLSLYFFWISCQYREGPISLMKVLFVNTISRFYRITDCVKIQKNFVVCCLLCQVLQADIQTPPVCMWRCFGTVTVHQSFLNHFWRKVGVMTEASWELLHVNCRQLSKFYLQCFLFVMYFFFLSSLSGLKYMKRHTYTRNQPHWFFINFFWILLSQYAKPMLLNSMSTKSYFWRNREHGNPRSAESSIGVRKPNWLPEEESSILLARERNIRLLQALRKVSPEGTSVLKFQKLFSSCGVKLLYSLLSVFHPCSFLVCSYSFLPLYNHFLFINLYCYISSTLFSFILCYNLYNSVVDTTSDSLQVSQSLSQPSSSLPCRNLGLESQKLNRGSFLYSCDNALTCD